MSDTRHIMLMAAISVAVDPAHANQLKKQEEQAKEIQKHQYKQGDLAAKAQQQVFSKKTAHQNHAQQQSQRLQQPSIQKTQKR